MEQLVKEAEEGVETRSETAIEGDNASGIESDAGHAEGELPTNNHMQSHGIAVHALIWQCKETLMNN